jgi:hypothetical protein
MFQLPKAPAMPVQSAQMTNMERMQQLQQLSKMPIAVQRASLLLVLLPIIVVMAVVGGGIFVATRAFRGGVGGFGGGSKMMWAGNQPLLIDIDGDGVPDPIGVARYVQDGDRAHFAAFSGKTGGELWESEPIGNYSNISQDHLGASGNLILIASATGTLTARDAKAKGKVVWQVSFGEKIDMMCAAAGGEIAIATADQKWFVVNAKGAKRDGKKLIRLDRDYTNDGARAAFEHVGGEAGDVCVPLLAGRRSTPGAITMRSWRDVANIPNMRIELLIKRLGGPTIVIGAKQPGTAVPMLARLGATPAPPSDDPKKRHAHPDKEHLPAAAWAIEVPAIDPLVSRLDAEHVAVSDKAVFALYQGASSTHRLTAFELASGKRLWDRPIQHGSGFVPVGLTVTGDVVMLATWQNLIAFGIADGGDRFKIGGSW